MTTHLSRIVGNDPVLHGILATARAESPHSGYLFAGPEGVGRRQVALAMARALNCRAEDPAERPCEGCAQCRKILGDNHPDVWTVEPTGKARIITVKQIRELQRQVALRRGEGRFRVVIVEDAQSMRVEAANSFLKTLEEPPAGTVLVLLVTQIGAVLPTIQSRCQKIRFAPIPPDVLARHLVEEVKISPDEARLRAEAAGGSIGVALALDPEATRGEGDLLGTFAEVLEGGPGRRLGFAEDLGRDRERTDAFLDLVLVALRDIAATRRGRAPLRSDLASPRTRLDAALPGPLVQRAFARVMQAREDRGRNVNPRLILESLVFSLAPADTR